MPEDFSKPEQTRFRYRTVDIIQKECWSLPAYKTPDLRTLKGRATMLKWARFSYENSPIYRALIDRATELIVGTDGVEIQALSPQRKEIEALWKRFCFSADVRSKTSFTGLEREIVRELLNVGEVLIQKIPGVFPKLRIISSERIKEVNVDRDGAIASITLNDEGEPTLRGDEIVYISDSPQPEGVRGRGILWSVGYYISYLDQILGSTAKSASEAAKLAVIVTTDEGAPLVAEGEEAPLCEENEAGQIWTGKRGENIQILKNELPPQGLESGLAPFLKLIASVTGLPADTIILGDYSKSSYSSNRAMNLQVQRTISKYQNAMIYAFYLPIYQMLIGSWTAAKALKQEDGLLNNVQFLMPKLQSLDPQKEAMADSLRLQTGLATKNQILRERNLDPDQVLADRASEIVAAHQAAMEIEKATGLPIATTLPLLAGTGLDLGALGEQTPEN